ncbi:MAG: DNA cytosine methyltransferase [Ketobacter sp.]|nr:DNA cytosine methyltransferase [Ketobacter sp.]
MMGQKAKAPRDKNAPTVISTFAGGGGSTTGYHMAGYRELLAVEWDDNAVETLRLNYPDLDIYHGDIAKLSVDEVLTRTGLNVGELDILDGSPPCQGFSTAGKRVMSDPRNQLFREYIRLLRGIMPKVFVMENVSGMVKGKMKLVFVDILKELKVSGYKVSARLLNAKYFHVPQSRERLIFIGVREDLGIEPSYPKAESGEIPFVEDREYDKSLKLSDDEFWKLKEHKRKQAEKGNSFSYHVHKKGHVFRTLKKTETGGDRSLIKCGKETVRKPSDDEYRRIGSFPQGYVFHGGVLDLSKRIGNSVPPLFMEAIARHIRINILQRCKDAFGITPELIA